jgi:8-oxo-dGTP diphosphatase
MNFMQMDPIPNCDPSVQKYVVGFMFSGGLNEVALIRKNKPAWQRGKLNGIGGKVDGDELPKFAMWREFKEETGYDTTEINWNHYANMRGRNDDGTGFEIDFFACIGPVAELRTVEAEKVEIHHVSNVAPHRYDVIENLPWLIAAAIDHLQDGRPSFIAAVYK